MDARPMTPAMVEPATSSRSNDQQAKAGARRRFRHSGDRRKKAAATSVAAASTGVARIRLRAASCRFGKASAPWLFRKSGCFAQHSHFSLWQCGTFDCGGSLPFAPGTPAARPAASSRACASSASSQSISRSFTSPSIAFLTFAEYMPNDG